MHSVAKMQLQSRNKFYVVADFGYAAWKKQKIQFGSTQDLVNSRVSYCIYHVWALTPHGGVYQIRVGDNNWNITSFNSTIAPLESGKGEFDVQLPKQNIIHRKATPFVRSAYSLNDPRALNLPLVLQGNYNKTSGTWDLPNSCKKNVSLERLDIPNYSPHHLVRLPESLALFFPYPRLYPQKWRVIHQGHLQNLLSNLVKMVVSIYATCIIKSMERGEIPQLQERTRVRVNKTEASPLFWPNIPRHFTSNLKQRDGTNKNNKHIK